MFISKKPKVVMCADDLIQPVKNNNRSRFQSTASEKVLKHLKEKYGTVANGINVLALKDMGEL